MRIFLFALGLVTALGMESYAQCTVQAFPDDTVYVWCGYEDTLSLYAAGNSGNQVLSNNFDNGTPGTGWQATPAATFVNPCGPSPNGTIHMWMGDATPQPRILTTQSFDLSLGGTICFEMRFSIQGDAAPCEGPDEPDEGVYLQYSINNGSTWNTINYFDPLGGNDPILTTWQQYCFNIPLAAQTTNTQIRWFQDATSGAEYDHWGLDNVDITLNDPTAVYTWLHNGYVGQTPPDVIISSDSIFTVMYTNGNGDTCTSDVVVVAIPPVLSAQTIPDTSFCDNAGCVDLNGIASVVFSPDTHLTFINNELQPIATISIPLPGTPPPTTAININVQGINNDNVGTAEIESVCIDGLTYFGFDFITQTQVDISSLDIALVCPSGDTIDLILAGTTVGTNNAGYSNTCFVPSGGADISQATAPYSGDFQPAEPFSNLNGCVANGLWQMLITNNSGVGFGQGIFNGWSISFHDPEISEPATFSWSPTTNMTNENTLNPTVCPTQSTTYTLTVTDSANCATVTHDVTIGIVNSVDLQIGAILTDAICGEDNGEISLDLDGNSGGEYITWSNGETTNDITGLSAGTYTVTVTDGCVKDTTFTISGSPLFDVTASIDDVSCDADNGSIGLNVTGNNGNLNYQWSNGETTSSIDGLSPGTYDVTISDDDCSLDSSFVVTEEPSFTISAALVDAVCTTGGSIEVTVMNNNGTVTYDWSNGENTPSIDGLEEGTYSVTIEDGSCTLDTAFSIANTVTDPPVITSVDTTAPFVGTADGALTINSTGGTLPLQYSIDGGTTFQTENVFENLEEGTYSVVVQDANGCDDTLTVVLESYGEVFVPSVFNPSSNVEDNSYFTVVGMKEPEVVIYNRWGIKVFEDDAYKNDWSGDKHKDGVYYYVIKNKADGKYHQGFVQMISD